MESWIPVLQELFALQTLLFLTAGVFIGMVLGAIPGLGAGIGVVLLLPFTYSMSPATGLLLLGGVFMGNSYGGAVSGILLNVPGTPVAAMTTAEGYPMALKGEAKQALLLSLFSSVFGGFIGILALIFFTPPLAAFALQLGPAELFLVAVFGLTIVGSVSGKSIVKGIFAACVGVLLSLVGQDPVTYHPRFTFGSSYLASGLNLIPLVVGIFALTEMFAQMGRLGDASKADVDVSLERISALAVLKKLKRAFFLLVKSSVIGTIIGIIPGTGAAIASFVGYAEAKRTSKEPDTFGHGNPRGIIAAESANNASVGGSLVPLLALGIPGSATAAILYGALTLHGLIPGPRLFTDNWQLVYVFMFGMVLTVVAMWLLGVLAAPVFALVIKVRLRFIIPAVTVFSLLGAYSARNSVPDMFFALFCGLIGLLFRVWRVPIPPVVLGFILGSMVEQNLRRASIIAGSRDLGLFEYIVFKPISLIIIGLLFLMLVVRVVRMVRASNGK